jgi:hypothetical protein
MLACANSTVKLPNVFFNLNQNKWTTSKVLNFNCVDSVADAYKLCKRLYPNLIIENVIESNNFVDFELYDVSSVVKQAQRPYVCLYGQYKSIALNVPVGCEFKHVYDENRCETKDYWLKLAQDKCETGSQSLNKSHILQWCGSNSINTFMGIQYVCCAKTSPSSTRTKVIDNDGYDLDDVYDLDTYEDYDKQRGHFQFFCVFKFLNL